jgi:hypothetical protein
MGITQLAEPLARLGENYPILGRGITLERSLQRPFNI